MSSKNSDVASILDRINVKMQVDIAKEDATAQGVIIITPDIETEPELNKLWDDYNQMTKPFRRRADWICIDRFGFNNQDIYQMLKSIFLSKHNIGMAHVDGNVGSSEDPLILAEAATADVLNFVSPPDRVDAEVMLNQYGDDLDIRFDIAEAWYKETGKIVIIPKLFNGNLNDLERLWESFNMMILKHRRESDWKMQELVGLTNMQLYLHWKKILEANEGVGRINLPPISSEDFALYSEDAILKNYFLGLANDRNAADLLEGVTNLLSLQDSYDYNLSNNIISDVLDTYDGLTQNVPTMDLNVGELPMYTPDEMIDQGVFSGNDNLFAEEAPEDIQRKQWFEEYQTYFYTGIPTDRFLELNVIRICKLKELSFLEEKDDSIKQAMLEWGWNPYIPFNENTREKATKIIKETMSSSMNRSTIINLDEFGTSDVVNINLPAPPSTDTVVPIYIALESANSGFATAIKTITNGMFSHAMISFDASMEKLYSYGIDMKIKTFGSFIVENIYNKPKNTIFKIYTVFVKSDVYAKMKSNVEWFIENQRKTHYAWSNLFYFLFKVPHNRDADMICSQFVDKILKIGGIDFTKVDPSLVSPNDIDRAAKKNRKIYTLFTNTVDKFNPKKLLHKVEKLKSRAKVFGEASHTMIKDPVTFSYYMKTAVLTESYDVLATLERQQYFEEDKRVRRIYQSFVTPCLEARKFPIEIKDNGDVKVYALLPSDYEGEFAKAHKLLVEYEKTRNLEGMKEELAHLWYMNILIEARLHSKKKPLTGARKNDLDKARAKILNDFKKYLNFVQKEEPKFNFSDYYEKSKYSDKEIEITGGTIKGAIDYLKLFINQIF